MPGGCARGLRGPGRRQEPRPDAEPAGAAARRDQARGQAMPASGDHTRGIEITAELAERSIMGTDFSLDNINIIGPDHFEKNGYPHAEWTYLRKHAPVF